MTSQAVKPRAGKGSSTERFFDLTSDVAALDAAIEQVGGCRLVIIDPITAYLGDTDSHKNAEVRAALALLVELAQRRSVAIVCVTHLDKATNLPAIYRAMGSLAFVAAARAVWAVMRDPRDKLRKRRLFVPVKNNLGNDPTGLAYRLEHAQNGTVCVAWDAGTVDATADDAINGAPNRRSAEQRERAADFLRRALANETRKSSDLIAEARELGIAEKTLRRAFGDLNGKAHRVGYDDAEWRWSLPEDSHLASGREVAIFDDDGDPDGPPLDYYYQRADAQVDEAPDPLPSGFFDDGAGGSSDRRWATEA